MIKRVCMMLVLVIVAATAVYFWFILPMNWIIVSSALSPEKNWVAHRLASMSEAGLAPYGEHIVISKTSQFYGEFYGETVFAGYCKSDLQYQWVDKNTLEVNCEDGDAVKQSKTYKEVTIRYVGLKTK